MANGNGAERAQRWDLPPLILHPFGHGVEAEALLQSARLSLYAYGLLEPGGSDHSLREKLLRARYREFQMLCLIGKDVMRWMRQCVDFTSRDEVLARGGFREQSFADLLVERTPPTVTARFTGWGVIDYRRILSRSIGLNAVFPAPPAFDVVAAEFLENYYAYADGLYHSHQNLTAFARLEPDSFGVALYTSNEYLSKLDPAAEE